MQYPNLKSGILASKYEDRVTVFLLFSQTAFDQLTRGNADTLCPVGRDSFNVAVPLHVFNCDAMKREHRDICCTRRQPTIGVTRVQ